LRVDGLDCLEGSAILQKKPELYQN